MLEDGFRIPTVASDLVSKCFFLAEPDIMMTQNDGIPLSIILLTKWFVLAQLSVLGKYGRFHAIWRQLSWQKWDLNTKIGLIV